MKRFSKPNDAPKSEIPSLIDFRLKSQPMISSLASFAFAAFASGWAFERSFQSAPSLHCWCECTPAISRPALYLAALVGAALGAGGLRLWIAVRPSVPVQTGRVVAAQASVGTQTTGSNLALIARRT